MDRPRMRVSSVVLGAADPQALADFYHQLLGWEIAEQYPARPGFPPQDGWAMLRPPPGELGLRGLAIQWEPDYLPPIWPPVPGKQQMMLHLDIAAEDLQAAVAWALQAGATLADHQPQDHVRVLLDTVMGYHAVRDEVVRAFNGRVVNGLRSQRLDSYNPVPVDVAACCLPENLGIKRFGAAQQPLS